MSDGVSRRSFVQGVVAVSAGVSLTTAPLDALSFDAASPTGLLDARVRRTLVCVANHLIPRDAVMPGAGEAGAAALIEEELGRVPHVLRDVTDLLAGLPDSDDLERLSEDDVRAWLERSEQSHPEIFQHLVAATYRGYYRHPAIVAALNRT